MPAIFFSLVRVAIFALSTVYLSSCPATQDTVLVVAQHSSRLPIVILRYTGTIEFFLSLLLYCDPLQLGIHLIQRSTCYFRNTMKIPCLLPLLASTSAFVPNTIMFKHPATTQLYMMYDRVEEAISDAQRICAQSGPESRPCRVAWDIVEELEAADSHRGQDLGGANHMSPDGEAAMLSSFEILLQKMDGKMDQCMATTEKLSDLGLRDHSIAELHRCSMQMKEAIWNARQSMGQ